MWWPFQSEKKVEEIPAEAATSQSPPSASTSVDEEKLLDDVEKMIRATGCWQQHVDVAECMDRENRDWRKCQNEVSKFAKCMQTYYDEDAKRPDAAN